MGGKNPPVVLVVDDESLIRWALGEAFERAGYRVSKAATGAEGLACLAALSDEARVVVLIDLRLPDVDDLSLVRTMRDRRPDAPMIVMTARASAELTAEVCAAGVTEVLSKPFDIPAVVAAVDRATILTRRDHPPRPRR